MPRKAPPPARRADRLPSAHGGMSRFAYARAKSAGLALDTIIKEAGLTRQQLDDPHAHHRGARSDQVSQSGGGGPAGRSAWLSYRADSRPSRVRASVLPACLVGDAPRRAATDCALQHDRQRRGRPDLHARNRALRVVPVSRRQPSSRPSSDRMLDGRSGADVPRAHGTAARSLARAVHSPAEAKIKGPSCRNSSARLSSSARRSMMSRSRATPRKRGSSARTPT